jgi:ParB/RepB/Spo0J family partition protein
MEMNAIETTKVSNEYSYVAIVELTESTTNPRKTFDDASLKELAQSIRNHCVLSPLLVRTSNGHLEIVSGARRYRAAQRAGLAEIPVRLLELADTEAQELQIIELSVVRKSFLCCNTARHVVHMQTTCRDFALILDEGTVFAC